MAALVADSYSTEATKIVGVGYEQLMPTESRGRRRASYFSYTVPAGGEADDNHVFACKIPEGARILGGSFKTDGCGAGAQVDIGVAAVDGSGYIDTAETVSDDDDFFGAAVDIAAAGADAFASTIAQNYGYKTEKELWLVLTVENAAWGAAAEIAGDIEYVVD